jgi:hypothetical protein
MSLITCPECKKKISDKSNACTYCGYPLTPDRVAGLIEQQKEIDKKYARRLKIGCGSVFAFFAFWFLLAILSPTSEKSKPAVTEITAPAETQVTAPIQNSDISSDESHSIIKTDSVPGEMRSLDIQLNKRISKEALQKIALTLKSQDSRAYKRTFIGYFLPDMYGMKIAWATTHFDPDLKIEIMGLTIDEENKLMNMPQKKPGEIIGQWISENPYWANARWTILKGNDKKFKIIEDLPGGESNIKSLIKKTHVKETRYIPEGETHGEYYLIDNNGPLSVYDEDGLFYTMRPIGRNK